MQVAAAAQYLVRVTFGTALITSVLLVWFTIVAILTSSQSSDSDRRRAADSPGFLSTSQPCSVVHWQGGCTRVGLSCCPPVAAARPDALQVVIRSTDAQYDDGVWHACRV